MVRVDFIIMCFVQFFVYVWQCFKTVPQDRNLTAGGLLYGFLQMHLRYCLLQNAFSLNFKMKQGIKKGAAASPHKQTECWSLLPCATDNLASNCPDIFSKPVKHFDGFFFCWHQILLRKGYHERDVEFQWGQVSAHCQWLQSINIWQQFSSCRLPSSY